MLPSASRTAAPRASVQNTGNVGVIWVMLRDSTLRSRCASACDAGPGTAPAGAGSSSPRRACELTRSVPAHEQEGECGSYAGADESCRAGCDDALPAVACFGRVGTRHLRILSRDRIGSVVPILFSGCTRDARRGG